MEVQRVQKAILDTTKENKDMVMQTCQNSNNRNTSQKYVKGRNAAIVVQHMSHTDAWFLGSTVKDVAKATILR